MRLSSELRERLVRTATGAGLALALGLVALASPTPSVAAQAGQAVASQPHSAASVMK